MYANNKQCRPLLRGVLTAVFPWSADRERPGYQRQTCQLAVWCPYCRSMHYHGWDPADDGKHASHRAAHCTDDDSPFRKTGYYISVLRRSDPGFSAHVVTPGHELVRPIPEWELRRRAERAKRQGLAVLGNGKERTPGPQRRAGLRPADRPGPSAAGPGSRPTDQQSDALNSGFLARCKMPTTCGILGDGE